MRQLLLTACFPLACTAAEVPQVTVTAQRDAEWASYRHAYRAAAGFDVHLRTRPLIQAHMQVRPLRPGTSLDGLQIQLASASMTLNLPVDGIGRAQLPMLKTAYDEDAVLRLNRQKGHYRFSGRYSIRERDDGVYGTALLRDACEQMISAQRASGARLRLMGKKCAGVRFIFAPSDAGAAITSRSGDGKAATIATVDAEPFESGSLGMYKVAIYRFDAWPAGGEVITSKRPLAIGTVYE
ncbi:hypothetical protein KY495_11045 [Massilia sp. PAMC28688]|uniref:hypothetical protein n=1 Tax=Massilia sp. PAMC28688 TaxID=2861283 RepID=UPI001C633CDE|nr:hypothetical protein [Massilia sp. PAMC28688]QYF95632.1 hypothetical protein KY495_11045 [Massilia sp. PAMC28688]